MRLDKWLFYARLYKSREKSKNACVMGNILVNKCKKSNKFNISKNDLITFFKNEKIKIIKVIAIPKVRIPTREISKIYKII